MIYVTSNRLIDVKGSVPPGSIATFRGQSLFKVHAPYTLVGKWDTGYTINFEFNFLSNFRRVLSGNTGDWQFSASEEKLYLDYIDWMSGITVYGGEREVILTELDNWLVNELQFIPHYEMSRSYAKPTPWV